MAMKQLCWAGLAALFMCPVAWGDDADAVWRIGRNDRDFRDLAHAEGFDAYGKRFPEDVTFLVGRDDAIQHFSALHPGPADGWGGRREHPFRIEFDLPGPPNADCELRVDLVDTGSDDPPVLSVDVNGEKVQRMLPGGTGELSLVRPAKGSPRSLRFMVRADQLSRGRNRVELRIVRGSWVLYDALSLRGLPADEIPQVDVAIRPTIFFVERAGRVLQEVMISVQGLASAGPVRVEMAGRADGTVEADLGTSSLGCVEGAAYLEPVDNPEELTLTISSRDQVASVVFTQMPQKKWRLYCAPAAHTDIGYTHLQSDVVRLHNRNTDFALDLIQRFPLYHWNLESSWAAWTWFRDRPPERHAELLNAVRQGRIGIEAAYVNLLTGLCSGEELVRVMSYSARLAREHGLPFESYTLTDAPSHVWSLPSIIAGAGIRYLSVGVNQTRAPILNKGALHSTPFWWEGPDGRRVLTWFASGYHQGNNLGLTTRADTRMITPNAPAQNVWVGLKRMREAVERQVLWWAKRDDYPFDAIFFHGSHDDNVFIFADTAEAVTEYSRHYAYPKVILCSNAEFFRYVEERFAEDIPTVRGGGGSWWEDGAASSALETGMNRVAHEDAIVAETAWTALSTADPDVSFPKERFDRMWNNILLYDEHTWGAHNSIADPTVDFVHRQWAVKAGFALDAAEQSRRLLQSGLHDLAARVRAPEDAVLVFNPSGRDRSGLVELEIPRGMMIADDRGPVPQQPSRLAEDILPGITVAFRAENVPAVGYRTYRLVPADKEQPVPAKRFDGQVFENDFYRITFDSKTGGISSLFDKTLDRELVDQESEYKLGQLVYGAGSEERDGKTRSGCRDPAWVSFSSPQVSRQVLIASGPAYTTVQSMFPMDMFPWAEMQVVLHEHDRRVDFVFRLAKKLTYDKEAVYLAFPFAGENPRFRYEVGAGSVRPNTDQMAGACRDWFAVQRWVTVNSDDQAVAWSPLDTPLITLCDMTPGQWLDALPVTNGTIFAYVMNNYWCTNYKAGQDGDFMFRYSLTSDTRIDAAEASQFGESTAVPMRAVRVPQSEIHRPLPPGMSCFRVEPDNVALTAVKPADDGSGLILRVRETAGRDTATRIAIQLGQWSRALQCDLVEREKEPLSFRNGHVSVDVNANSMATIKLLR